ncbi:MAG: DUF790 family protein [Myxococcales bacterium]|nr:DUF790 family protein [Myxococcales bacterium]
MLTDDLVRARVLKGALKLRYIDTDDEAHRDLAAQILATYAAHVGQRREALEQALETLQGEGTDFLLHRGLAKLVDDKATWQLESPVPPEVLREALFAESAKHFPPVLVADTMHPVTRDEVIARVAAAHQMAPEAVTRAMYADLKDEAILGAVADFTPVGLLERYNLALAQSALLRASSLTLTLSARDPARLRQLFRYIKFYRLMHTVNGSAEAGYTVHLDGPLSVLQLSQKYGLQLASFLPALALSEGWRAEASLLWGRERRPVTLQLSSADGLRSYYPDTGVYVTREEAWLEARMAEVGNGWRLVRKAALFDLGGRGVLVPEYAAEHDDGRVAWVDLMGFWRRETLENRIALLREWAPKNLVTLVPWRLRGEEEALETLPGEMMYYRDTIVARELIARLEMVATRTPKADERERAKSPEKKRKPRAKPTASS